jgi:hypothetical protein
MKNFISHKATLLTGWNFKALAGIPAMLTSVLGFLTYSAYFIQGAKLRRPLVTKGPFLGYTTYFANS